MNGTEEEPNDIMSSDITDYLIDVQWRPPYYTLTVLPPQEGDADWAESVDTTQLVSPESVGEVLRHVTEAIGRQDLHGETVQIFFPRETVHELRGHSARRTTAAPVDVRYVAQTLRAGLNADVRFRVDE